MKLRDGDLITVSGRLVFRTAVVVGGSPWDGLIRVRFAKRRGGGFVKHALLVREEDILYRSPAGSVAPADERKGFLARRKARR